MLFRSANFFGPLRGLHSVLVRAHAPPIAGPGQKNPNVFWGSIGPSKGSELLGSCESFFEGVHGLKLIRGSKNVAIGGFCIGGYDENRHHIFRSQQNFSARSAGSLSFSPGSRPPLLRARAKTNPFLAKSVFFCLGTPGLQQKPLGPKTSSGSL